MVTGRMGHAGDETAEIDAVRLTVRRETGIVTIWVDAAPNPSAGAQAVLIRAESLTGEGLDLLAIKVDAGGSADLAGLLLAAGVARRNGPGVQFLPGVLWQCASRWLPQFPAPFRHLDTVTAGRRHPLRPPIGAGTFYRRAIP